MPVGPKELPYIYDSRITQEPVNTTDHQRFDEMLIHLTPFGCTIPYNIEYDINDDIWVASKGGLFKFCGKRHYVLWCSRNAFPKRQAAYCQVCIHNNIVIYTTSDDKAKLTKLQFLDLNGASRHEQFIEGLVQGLTVSPDSTLYMTKQIQSHEDSVIYRTTIDNPLDWRELCRDPEMTFQGLCAYDDSLLISACVQTPVNLYSKQCLQWINASTGKVLNKVSSEGKDSGEIFFPRKLARFVDDILVLDKTGRFLKFDRNGSFLGISAKVDAYLANGFCINQSQATIACSGIVQDERKQTICDDWLEVVRLN